MRTALKVIGLVIVGIMVLAAIVVALDDGSSEPEPTPTIVQATGQPTAMPPTPVPTAEPGPAVTPTFVPTIEPTVESTPTAEESLQEFVLCDRVLANLQMRWGQAPGTIYSDDPRVYGNLEPGDYVQFLMPQPTENGEIRVKVYPHDNRTVGNTDNQVWIDWSGLIIFRLDREMFTCES